MSQPYGEYVPEGVTIPPVNLKDWILHVEMNICDAVFWFADEFYSTFHGGLIDKYGVSWNIVAGEPPSQP